MVRNRKELPCNFMQVCNSVVCETRRRAAYNDIYGLGNHRVLEIIHTFDIEQHVFKGADRKLGENILADYRKSRMPGKFLHGSNHFFVAVGLDIF